MSLVIVISNSNNALQAVARRHVCSVLLVCVVLHVVLVIIGIGTQPVTTLRAEACSSG
jgi:arginine exporter protein ArgO